MGKRVYRIVVTTTQDGAQFFGTLKSSFEIKDSAGNIFYGAATSSQQCAYKSRSDCEWIIEVDVEDIDKPVVTAYAVAYYIPGLDEPLDEKTLKCKDITELAERNKDSASLPVNGKTVSLTR